MDDPCIFLSPGSRDILASFCSTEKLSKESMELPLQVLKSTTEVNIRACCSSWWTGINLSALSLIIHVIRGWWCGGGPQTCPRFSGYGPAFSSSPITATLMLASSWNNDKTIKKCTLLVTHSSSLPAAWRLCRLCCRGIFS